MVKILFGGLLVGGETMLSAQNTKGIVRSEEEV